MTFKGQSYECPQAITYHLHRPCTYSTGSRMLLWMPVLCLQGQRWQKPGPRNTDQSWCLSAPAPAEFGVIGAWC